MDHKIVWSVVLSVLGTLVLLGLGFLVWANSGEYNIAATKPHVPVVGQTLERIMEASVRDHAADVRVPPLGDSAQVETGFQHFGAMCVTCHGAPGVERSEIGKGLLPEPPELSEAVPEWTPAELFWIVKHGIKMSGMPAFGVTHDDEQIWGIVAFLERLPELSPAEYEALRGAQAGANGHENDHGHGAAEQTGGGQPAETGDEHEHQDGGAEDGHEHDHEHSGSAGQAHEP